MSAIVKGKVTNSFKPPLTERPFALGYRELSEMSNWKWWMSERKKQLNKVFVLWWGSEVKQYGNYDKRAKSKRRGNQLKKSHTQRGEGYPKCAIVRTRGREVKNSLNVTKWMTPNSYSKRHTKIVIFEFIHYCCHLC